MEKMMFDIDGTKYSIQSETYTYPNGVTSKSYKLVVYSTGELVGYLPQNEESFNALTVFELANVCKELISGHKEK